MAMKVLLVDDSSTMRKIILRSLNAVGITDVAEAGDGEEAFTMFGPGGFNLVLTDWNMPKKNGLELVKSIRESGSKVPIVMITTEAEKQQVLTAVQAGVNDYLLKPFTAEVLREKLERFAS